MCHTQQFKIAFQRPAAENKDATYGMPNKTHTYTRIRKQMYVFVGSKALKKYKRKNCEEGAKKLLFFFSTRKKKCPQTTAAKS